MKAKAYTYQRRKTMKKILAIAILMGAMAWNATAQERRGERPQRSAEEIATQRTKHLTERLNLTAEQQEAVYGLQLEEANRQRELISQRRAAAAEARIAR